MGEGAVESQEQEEEKKEIPLVTTVTVKQQRRDVVDEYTRDPSLAMEVRAVGAWRPRTRGQCAPCRECQLQNEDPSYQRACEHSDAESIFHCRPCPFVGCRHHLYLEVGDQARNRTEGVSIHFNHPAKEPGDLKMSCSLDAASRGGITLDQVGFMFAVTRERVRQIEARVLRVMRLRKRTDLGIFHED